MKVQGELRSGAPQPGLPTPRRYIAIFAASCGAAAVVVDATAPAVALPSIAQALEIDQATSTLVVAIYQMVLVTTLLPFAAVGERIGCRKVYVSGQAIFAVASFLCLFVHSLPELLSLRVLQGFGASATLSCSGALLRSIYPSRHLGRAMGVQGTVVSLAMAAAPSLGGLILSAASWPWVFACAAPLSGLALLNARSLPEIAGQPGQFDWWAAAICALMFALLMSALQMVGRSHLYAVPAVLGLSGAVVAVFFVRHQRAQERPILPVDILAEPVLGLSALGALLAFASSMVIILVLPFRLTTSFGMSPALVGLALSAYPLTLAALAPIAGLLSDRVRPDVPSAVGLGIGSAGLFLLGSLGSYEVTTFAVVWRLVIVGLGFGLFMTPNARVIVGSIPMHRTASGSSLISLTRLAGQTLGSAIAGVLLALNFGHTSVPALAASVLALGAAALCLLRSRFFSFRRVAIIGPRSETGIGGGQI